MLPPPETPYFAALTKYEGCLALLLCAVLFIGNFATTAIGPAFTPDEVSLSDAGVNLALGHGYTSTAWRGQSKEELFGGNSPLHPLLVAAWVRAFGFGFWQMRALPILCGSVAAFALWWAVRRLAWIQYAWARLLMIPMVFLPHPIIAAYRVVRYDALQILLCVAVLVVLACRLRPWAERLALGAAGILIAVSGFQVAAYAGLCCALGCWWNWREGWPKALAVCVGLGLGGGAVFGWLAWNHILHGLWDNIAVGHHTDGNTPALLWKARFSRVVFDSLRDISLLLLAAVIVAVTGQKSVVAARPELRRLRAFAFLTVATITIGIEAAIHFPPYYRWMTYLPAALVTLAILGRAASILTPARRRLAAFALAALMIFGPARDLGYGLMMGTATQRRELDELVARNLRPNDVVFADFAGYCAAKTHCTTLYSLGYVDRMTPEDKASMTAILGVENELSSCGDLGEYFSTPARRWVKVAQVPPYDGWMLQWVENRFPRFIDYRLRAGASYQLTLYRSEAIISQDRIPASAAGFDRSRGSE